MKNIFCQYFYADSAGASLSDSATSTSTSTEGLAVVIEGSEGPSSATART